MDLHIVLAIAFTLFGVIAIITCLDTPHSWWRWRIVKQGDSYYIEAIGVLKPWWHKIPDWSGCPMEFDTLEEAMSLLLRHAQKESKTVEYKEK